MFELIEWLTKRHPIATRVWLYAPWLLLCVVMDFVVVGIIAGPRHAITWWKNDWNAVTKGAGT